MKKFTNALFWILTDALIIFGLAFLPSVFSIFCFLTAIIIVPIEEWQNILQKILKKPIKSVAILLLSAFVIVQFPLSDLVAGIYNAITPPTSSQNIIVYYEETSNIPSESKTETVNSTANTTSKSNNNSSKKQSSLTNTSSKHNTPANSDSVYRTPSGKRYHINSECGGKNSYEVTMDEALREGLTPCKRCIK